MLEIARELCRWDREGRSYAVATVVAVRGSAPREPGAALAVDEAGRAVGSVSGGCVEGAVYELCREVLETGVPVVRRFGYSDEDAFAVGLTCGGDIEVLVQRAEEPHRAAVAAVARGESLALVRAVGGREGDGSGADGARMDGACMDGAPVDGAGGLHGALLVHADGRASGGLAGPDRGDLDHRAARRAGELLARGGTGVVRVDGTDLFVECHLPPPRMLVFGAVDFAAALARAGAFLGYRVTVCDARPVFATAERFPDAAEVVVDWPHRYLRRTAVDARTAVCVLTHDARFDIPLLTLALRLPVAYVGAMGSRRTHDERLARLREAGLTGAELSRLRSPIGLDLGARTPQETAVSIAAEIVADRHGASGLRLRDGSGPVHGGRAADGEPGGAADLDPVRTGLLTGKLS